MRIVKETRRIAAAVIDILSTLPEAEVDVKLEIMAKVPSGVSEAVVRTVSEKHKDSPVPCCALRTGVRPARMLKLQGTEGSMRTLLSMTLLAAALCATACGNAYEPGFHPVSATRSLRDIAFRLPPRSRSSRVRARWPHVRLQLARRSAVATTKSSYGAPPRVDGDSNLLSTLSDPERLIPC
jgi:hypothetical protein